MGPFQKCPFRVHVSRAVVALASCTNVGDRNRRPALLGLRHAFSQSGFALNGQFEEDMKWIKNSAPGPLRKQYDVPIMAKGPFTFKPGYADGSARPLPSSCRFAQVHRLLPEAGRFEWRLRQAAQRVQSAGADCWSKQGYGGTEQEGTLLVGEPISPRLKYTLFPFPLISQNESCAGLGRHPGYHQVHRGA